MNILENSFILLLIFLLGVKAYSQEIGDSTVTDYDGNVYKTVKIGNQIWTAENIRVTHFNDGTSIPQVTDNIEWSNLLTPGYCFYNNDSTAYSTIYGALYNWYAVETNNLCPIGWHVPDDEEWKELEIFLGMSEADADKATWRGQGIGGKLKELGTVHWYYPNEGATNETGFSATPSGSRAGGKEWGEGRFSHIGILTTYWTATNTDTDNAFHRTLDYSRSEIFRAGHGKKSGFCVRCIKDNIATGISDIKSNEIPNNFTLYQNFPNPFNPSTTIKYNLQKPGNVVLKIYNIVGQEVAELINGIRSAGEHQVVWQPEGLSSGVYLARIMAGTKMKTTKLILQK
ncbi:MAG: FISUMP domain-containing protein [Ignavibacteria bacterium]|jgi:uncharacterized protein (TIGR02145 family)